MLSSGHKPQLESWISHQDVVSDEKQGLEEKSHKTCVEALGPEEAEELRT